MYLLQFYLRQLPFEVSRCDIHSSVHNNFTLCPRYIPCNILPTYMQEDVLLRQSK